MEEWQRRQKAEKEDQRKKKTESAQILHGYHGGVNDADLKLKNLKEEERKKLQDAQQNLHNYKAKEIEIAKKERPQQQQSGHPVPVNISGETGRDARADIVEGSVSERAAALAAQAAAGLIPSPSSTQPTSLTAAMSEAPPFVSEPEVAAGVEAPPESTFDAPMSMETAAPITSSEEPRALEPAPVVVAPAPVAVAAPEPVAVQQPAPVKVEALEPTAESPLPAPVEPTTAPVEPVGLKNVTNGKSAPVRLDVLFSFGLVTVQPKQEMENYMNAVQTVVSKSPVPGITFDPSNPPFVKDQQVDGVYIEDDCVFALLSCICEVHSH